MSDIPFGRPGNLRLTEAWAKDARNFIPWLAAETGHLADVIDVPPELPPTEVAEDSFTADIVARNGAGVTTVRIANQLETTEHAHLGRIIAYLAGLEAQTVVWIAPAFREQHLAACHRGNHHPADGFAFFAVRARVARIGDSPFAPIFVVAGKPDDWEHRLTSSRRAAEGIWHSCRRRRAVWPAYPDRVPGAADRGLRDSAASSAWVEVPDRQVTARARPALAMPTIRRVWACRRGRWS